LSDPYWYFFVGVGVQPRWYHFNDMLVEPFDPSEIGAQCFGGEETTATWDAIQNKRILKSQFKPNNAYMLFYTKVIPNPEPSKQPSSLSESRELNINANLNTTSSTKSLRTSKTYASSREALESSPSLHTSPVSSSYITPETFPHDLFIQVWRENQQFLHDKHIFDPAYFNFVNNILTMAPDQLSSKDMTDGNEEKNVSFDQIFKVIELGTRFFIETFAHAKDRETMNDLVTQLMTRYSTHIPV
jgi:ubiquitin carboxyl-terminal hydrolase 34